MLNPDLPNIDNDLFDVPDLARLLPTARASHPPRILLLYGSARERSYSQLLTEEAARLLSKMGAEPKIFDPAVCPCLTMPLKATPRCKSCGSLRNGQKAWCGPRPSAMVQ